MQVLLCRHAPKGSALEGFHCIPKSLGLLYTSDLSAIVLSHPI